MTHPRFGILAAGSYLPRARLPGQVVADAHGWFEPSLKRQSRVARSFCGWDEDALTMAVEAARVCVSEEEKLANVELASTSLPYADRSNVGVLREALALPNGANLTDSGGSLRAASGALSRALASDASTLLIASDCLDSKPASANEASLGHAAAAVKIGNGEPIAVLRGEASLQQDFVDHYRASGERFDYTLETRWTRDAGYRQQAGDTFAAALQSAGLERVDHLAVAAAPALAKAISRSLGQRDLSAALSSRVGYCAAAQPLLLLKYALEQSKPGETVAIAGIGQGVDVLVFEVTGSVAAVTVDAQVGAGVEENNYTRYLALRRLLEVEEGIRAERDNRTAQAAFWRKREAISGFIGGHCTECGTLQFPSTKVCVQCKTEDTQTPKRMADLPGTVRSFTEDWLAFTPHPPLVFGNVGFEDGANVMMEFTDVMPGQLEVGMPVTLNFRIKDFDHRRHFRRYFWKPTPVTEA